MPFSLTDEGSFVRIEWFGPVTADDLHGAADQLDAIARLKPVWPDNLADIRRVDGRTLDFPALMSLARRREALPLPNPIRTPVIAESSVSLGFARMFRNLSNNPSITIEVFATEDAAVSWLTSPR